jgi:fructose-1,6-bisphosphatase/inositol monophosphatase family enzyme
MGWPDLGRVGEVIREVAAVEALPRWRNLAGDDIVEKTGPEDVVTVADRAVELALTARLADLLPGSEVVGEEAVHADPSRLSLLGRETPAWVIDPIDGTSAFAAGSPDFAVMVALVSGRELVAGWILHPVTGVLTLGGRGEGVWQETPEGRRPLRLSPPPQSLAGMRGAIGRKRTDPARQARIAAAANQFASIEPAICAGLEYPRLAAGSIHFALYNKSEPWDHLPGLAMAVEQGYYFARHDGSPYEPGHNTGGLLVAPDKASWEEIREVLIG